MLKMTAMSIRKRLYREMREKAERAAAAKQSSSTTQTESDSAPAAG
jgi:hypothetical protein